MIFINAKVFYNGKFISGSIKTENGKILEVSPDINGTSDEIIDVNNNYILPGFIDIHTHGAVGHEFMYAHDNPKTLKILSEYYASEGTTSVVASTYAEKYDVIKSSVTAIGKHINNSTDRSGADIVGINIEGPYINKNKCGAQNPAYVRLPKIDEFKELIKLSGNHIRMVTVAPEVSGGIDAVKFLSSNNILASIGHSQADYKTACEAIDQGAGAITHFFNGLQPFSHRTPGVIGAGLFKDNVILELICDGSHVHLDAIKYLFKTKGAGKIAVVTDSISAAGQPDGEYILGSLKVVKKNNTLKLINSDTLAGSCAGMTQSFKNVLTYTGLPPEKIIPAFTETPAKAAGISDMKGSISIGKDADFIMMNADFDLLSTYVRGKMVFSVKQT